MINKKEETNEVQIDASGKALGRVASEAAAALRGKNSPDYERHVSPTVRVSITNASKLDIGPKKLKEKIYHHYSGYPGGMKTETLANVTTKKGYAEALRRAIYGMLPGNKLKKIMMNNLTITE